MALRTVTAAVVLEKKERKNIQMNLKVTQTSNFTAGYTHLYNSIKTKAVNGHCIKYFFQIY